MCTSKGTGQCEAKSSISKEEKNIAEQHNGLLATGDTRTCGPSFESTYIRRQGTGWGLEGKENGHCPTTSWVKTLWTLNKN